MTAKEFVALHQGKRARWYAADGSVWTGTIMRVSRVGDGGIKGYVAFKADPQYRVYEDDDNLHIDYPEAFEIIDNTPLPLPG